MSKLTMTQHERLMMQNLTLKIAVVRSKAAAEIAEIVAERERVARTIGGRLDIDINEYQFDVDTGAIIPRLKTGDKPGEVNQCATVPPNRPSK